MLKYLKFEISLLLTFAAFSNKNFFYCTLRQVVYLPDANGYVPLGSLRGPPQPIPPQLYAGNDLESWRPELWDREYNRRYRYNNTRVQREISDSIDFRF